MKTFLAQNQFISNSDALVPEALESAAASLSPPSQAAAAQITDPDGGYMGHRLSPALGTSVGSEAAVSVRTAAASDISDIPEIFFYARKLMNDAPRFVLNEATFMADVEEAPLFLREDGYLQRWEA